MVQKIDPGPELTKADVPPGVSPTTLRRFFPLFMATFNKSFQLNDGKRHTTLGFTTPAHLATCFSLVVTKHGLAERPKYKWHSWNLARVPRKWLEAVGLSPQSELP